MVNESSDYQREMVVFSFKTTQVRLEQPDSVSDFGGKGRVVLYGPASLEDGMVERCSSMAHDVSCLSER